MNIAVLVKTALDTSYLRIDPNTNKPLLDQIPLKISDIDRNAVEEAIRIKQAGIAKKITVFSMLTWGPIEKRTKEAQNALREVLAMGADEAYIIADQRGIGRGPQTTAKALAKAIKKYGDYKLVLCGEATIDMFSSEVPPRVAAELDYGLVTFARSLSINGENVKVERELDQYTEVIEAKLPLVISVTREINTPRLPTLLQIRLAVKKPINVIGFSDLELELDEPKVKYDFKGVQLTRKNIMIEYKSIDEAAEKLIEIIKKESK